MEKTKKIISTLLIFSLLLLAMGSSLKVFAEEVSLPDMNEITKEEYNQAIIEALGMQENPAEVDGLIVEALVESAFGINAYVNKDWISINGKSDLISLMIYDQVLVEEVSKDINKKYTVGYSETDGYIRNFTIEGLEFTYPGVMPTDTEFGIPFLTREDWNKLVNTASPETSTEMTGTDLQSEIVSFITLNIVLTENHPTWGLKVNGVSDVTELALLIYDIDANANYKVEYSMDNGYIREFTFEKISETTSTPTSTPTQKPTPSTTPESDDLNLPDITVPDLTIPEIDSNNILESSKESIENFWKSFYEGFQKAFTSAINNAQENTKKEYPNAGLENQTIIYVLLGIAAASVIAIVILRRKK